MPDFVLLDLDIAADVRRHYTPELLRLDKVRVQVHFPDDRKLLASAMKDPLLDQKMRAVARTLVTGDLARLMAYQVGVADTKAKEALRAGNQAQATLAVQSVERLLTETRSQIIPKIEMAAGQVWRDLTRTKKEYQTYQVKCGVRIAASTISAVGSVIAIPASAATGGATLAIALYKSVKDAVGLYQALWPALVQAETVEKEIRKTLETLHTRFTDISAKRAAALELAHSMVKAVDTPEKAKELNDTFGSKLQGVEVKAHRTAEALNAVLLHADAIAKTIAAEQTPAVGKAKGLPAAARTQARAKQLAAIESQVDQMIRRVVSLAERAEGGQQRQKEYAALVTQYQKRTPGWVPRALKVFELARDIGVPDVHKVGELLTDTALAIAGTYGDDIVDEAVARFGPPDAPVVAPTLSVSAPTLTSTTANLGAMKLRPLGPPPKR